MLNSAGVLADVANLGRIVREGSSGETCSQCSTMAERHLWSVLEMLRFYQALFITNVLWLQDPNVKWSNCLVDDDEYRAEMAKMVAELRRVSEECRLPAIVDRMDKIQRYIDRGADVKTIVTISTDVVGDIQRELARHLYLRVPYEDREYFERVPMSRESAEAFPSAVRDMEAAGRCFALNEWTACVMHCMRAAEFPIAALAKALNLNSSSPNWQVVLNECEREIRKIGPDCGPEWKKDEQFYSEVALSFRFLKNAWRNHVMHGREFYDRMEAEKIVTHIAEFMHRLSTRLSE